MESYIIAELFVAEELWSVGGFGLPCVQGRSSLSGGSQPTTVSNAAIQKG